MAQLDEHGTRILAFVERYQQRYRRSPTYREIGAAVGLASSDHVARDLRRLVQQGYLSFTPGVSRSIVLLKTPRRAYPSSSLPLPTFHLVPPQETTRRDELDQIAAGLFEEEKDTFILRARGDAMADAMLCDGDMALCQRSEEVKDGDLMAVYLKSAKRTTLKYMLHENGRLRLQSPLPGATPEYAKPSDLIIRGTVLAIIRKRDL